MSARRVVIAGAGIAGLAAAVAFAQRGWTVKVHERSAVVRGEGAGIYLSENGIRVLEALGVADAALAGCHNGYQRDTRDEKNRLLARVPLGRERSLRLVSVVRQQLLQALSDAAQRAGAEIEFGTAAVSATSDGVLVLADERRLPADLVIAADGINSSVRDSLGLLRRRKRFSDGANRFLISRLPEEQDVGGGPHLHRVLVGLSAHPVHALQPDRSLSCAHQPEQRHRRHRRAGAQGRLEEVFPASPCGHRPHR